MINYINVEKVKFHLLKAKERIDMIADRRYESIDDLSIDVSLALENLGDAICVGFNIVPPTVAP